jgi:putative drug exporter of the RND superfamily
MFAELGAFIYRNKWATLVVSAVFLAISVAVVVHGGRLTGGSYGDNEAERTEGLSARVLGHATNTTFIAIFHSDTLDPRNEPFQAAMKAALLPLANDPAVLEVMGPDEAPPGMTIGMVAGNAKSAVAMVSLKGDFKEALALYPEVRQKLRSDVLQISCTGQVPFMDNLDRVLQKDLIRAELISLPLALLVLLVVFRTLVAAALPVGVGALAVVGGIAAVLGLSHVVDIAEYTVNVCSLIGLGVAIDYSLFTLSRYREELAAGHDYPEALSRALDGAGRVVCFSGIALGTGLVGLMFFNGSFLAAMGLGGTIVVFLAIVFALTFLPAILAVLGPRIHALALPMKPFGPGPGFWRGTAAWVMKRPVTVLVPTLLVLLVMGIPFLRLRMTAADVRVLGLDVEARQGFELLKRDFPDLGSTRIIVGVEFPTAPALNVERIGALYDLGQRIAEMPHVTKVESIVNVEGMGKEDLETVLLDPPELYKSQIESGKKMTVGEKVVLLYVLTDSPPETQAAQDIVRTLRSHRSVLDGELRVGGQTAGDLDATDFVRSRTPRAIGFVMAMTMIILFLLLGSVVLPIKAIAMNFVSVAGSFGALVWVFQEGHLGIAEPRPVEHVLPVLLFCILFGLSMDYEVLMLSRIKEAYERTRDNTFAVAEGLEKTAGLITSAATIMVVVFAAFALAKVVVIRAVGFGMALAVAIDATLVRILLVPATMRLFGHLNWWAPKSWLAFRSALGLGREQHHFDRAGDPRLP